MNDNSKDALTMDNPPDPSMMDNPVGPSNPAQGMTQNPANPSMMNNPADQTPADQIPADQIPATQIVNTARRGRPLVRRRRPERTGRNLDIFGPRLITFEANRRLRTGEPGNNAVEQDGGSARGRGRGRGGPPNRGRIRHARPGSTALHPIH